MSTAMPLVKPSTTGRGMNRTAAPEAGDAHDDEQHAGHHGAHEQAVNAVLGDDCRDHHDERAGRTADLRRAIRRAPKSGTR